VNALLLHIDFMLAAARVTEFPFGSPKKRSVLVEELREEGSPTDIHPELQSPHLARDPAPPEYFGRPLLRLAEEIVGQPSVGLACLLLRPAEEE
jgi:hypothetical protein